MTSLQRSQPVVLVLLSIISLQFGSALAKSLFTQLPPSGVVLLRVGFAAIALLGLWHRQLNQLKHWRLLLGFGFIFACMNYCFYLSIARIPIGIAVALEFSGPLGVAITYSRHRLDLLWVLCAATGIVLLTPWAGFDINPLGVVFAFVAAGFWAAYILIAARVGKVMPVGAGLALAMAIATVIMFPIGLIQAGSLLLQPRILGLGLGVAFLSSVIAYSLEMEALRKLPVHVFGILLSLEPVAAALAGYVLLKEALAVRAIIAILLVSIAAAGAAQFSQRK